MSKPVDSLYTLYNNPFILCGILVEFYKHYSSHQKNDILLSYIVLPLTLYEQSKIDLQRANKKRSIRSFVKSNKRLFGFLERIYEYKEITNKAMQFALDQQYVSIDGELSVSFESPDTTSFHQSSKEHLVAAANLAKMVEDVDIISVFRQFGIKEL